MKRIPVCIVGGGPVGMNLALNLERLGVKSLIVNRDTDTQQQPRGSTQNARTMEHYRRLGLARGIRQLGLPPDHPTDVVYFTRLNGWELARIKMPSEQQKMEAVRDAGITDQVPEPLLRCNQMYVEHHILEHLKGVPHIHLRYGWRCIGWTEERDAVMVEIEDQQTGRTERIECAYLIGCDGGQSFVRRQLGIRYSGEATNTGQAYLSDAMVSSHIRAPGFSRLFPHKLGWQSWVLNASLRANIVTLNGDDELILLTQLANVDDNPDDTLIANRFIAAVGQELRFELIAHWKWIPGRALVADSFGRGRVLLAGDSVHLFTPTGGFGMNTGVDDVANLGWKLAATLQGWGGANLLATYEGERRPIALRNTSMAKYFSRNVGTLQIPSEIEEDSAAGAAARAEVGRSAAGFAEEFGSIGIQLGARYNDSRIVVTDGSTPPPDDPFVYVPSACPGGRAPHGWLPDRASLFDCFGPGFTLLRLGGDSRDDAAFRSLAARTSIPMKLLTIDVPALRDLYGTDLALIRPDQYIAWRGNRIPDDGQALLGVVVGRDRKESDSVC